MDVVLLTLEKKAPRLWPFWCPCHLLLSNTLRIPFPWVNPQASMESGVWSGCCCDFCVLASHSRLASGATRKEALYDGSKGPLHLMCQYDMYRGISLSLGSQLPCLNVRMELGHVWFNVDKFTSKILLRGHLVSHGYFYGGACILPCLIAKNHMR